jgi:RHS repeat-associated protein
MMSYGRCDLAQGFILRCWFTSKERDVETGLDYFGARYLSAAQGRFTSTDPIISGPHKLTNPQNWNLYSYAVNNPLRFTDPTGEIIEESIDEQYVDQYQQWKKSFLSTKAGKKFWDKYGEGNTKFTLTLTIGKNAGGDQGAETSGYGWDGGGQLNAATITLGKNLNSGYPAPDNYPVTSSLAPAAYGDSISGETLAATKLAHEFGHVETTGNTPMLQFQTQQANMPLWNALFFSGDPMARVVEGMMGGTSTQIKQAREWGAESAGAIPFLRDRFPGSPGQRMPNRVKQSIENFEKGK